MVFLEKLNFILFTGSSHQFRNYESWKFYNFSTNWIVFEEEKAKKQKTKQKKDQACKTFLIGKNNKMKFEFGCQIQWAWWFLQNILVNNKAEAI